MWLKTMPVVLCLLGTATSVQAQTATVSGGWIHGAMLDRGGAVFKGIPYAAPPVGKLRWREPAPVQSWKGVRETTAFGAACAQVPVFIPATESIKEDCLYLNVWTAEWPSKAPKPVMVWIPGGGNFGGASSQETYDSDALTRRGVVLVTVNYRLGPFGFFSHPALTRESPHHASGNQGILDQIAALKWVRDNIKEFGGDPRNVTVFGESAGSLDVGVLMTSPLSRGLFKRAIGESGNVVWADNLIGKPNTLDQAEMRGESLAARWGVPRGGSAAELRKISTAQILSLEPNYLRSDVSYKMPAMIQQFPYLGVVVDGYVVPRHPAEVFTAGKEHRVALLLGNNSRDGIPGTRQPEDFSAALDDTFGPLSSRAKALYVGERDDLYGMPSDQWTTDASFRCGTVAQLMWHSAVGNPSFEFEFSHTPPAPPAPPPSGAPPIKGAMHASELPYVFGTLDRSTFPGAPAAPTNAVDAQVSEVMQRYWTNFAKTGDPNDGQLPAWQKFNGNSRAYMQFTDGGPVAGEGLRRPYCDLFIDNVKRQLAQ